MDTSTLLFAAGIVGSIFLIVFLLSVITRRQRSKEANRLMNFFNRAAAASGLTITRKDSLQNRMIGLDEPQGRLIFIDYSKEKPEPVLLELKEVAGSRLMVNSDTVTEKVRGEDKVTDIFISSVKLLVQFRNKHLVPVELTFYRYGIDAPHDLEQLKEVAGSWNETINNPRS